MTMHERAVKMEKIIDVISVYPDKLAFMDAVKEMAEVLLDLVCPCYVEPSSKSKEIKPDKISERKKVLLDIIENPVKELSNQRLTEAVKDLAKTLMEE